MADKADSKYTGNLLLDGVDWETVRRFHGHLGPWIALGMLIGTDAFKRLNFKPHFGVTVIYEGPITPPVSCLVDGLTWSTGATYGKGNIRKLAGSEISVTVEAKDGPSLVYRVNNDVADQLTQLVDQMGEEKATLFVWSQPLETYCEMP